MKKKTIKSKLNLNKRVISKFNASKVKGGGSRRGCVGTNNCGPTSGTDNCGQTTFDCETVIGCGIT